MAPWLSLWACPWPRAVRRSGCRVVERPSVLARRRYILLSNPALARAYASPASRPSAPSAVPRAPSPAPHSPDSCFSLPLPCKLAIQDRFRGIPGACRASRASSQGRSSSCSSALLVTAPECRPQDEPAIGDWNWRADAGTCKPPAGMYKLPQMLESMPPEAKAGGSTGAST